VPGLFNNRFRPPEPVPASSDITADQRGSVSGETAAAHYRSVQCDDFLKGTAPERAPRKREDVHFLLSS